MPETVLVTGAAGFIGSHLTDRLLALGHRVVGVDSFTPFYPRELKESNLSRALKNDGFELHELDIRDGDAIQALFEKERPDSVFHLAAMAGVRPSIENPSLYADVNVGGTVRVLDAAVQSRVARFIFASSSSVYGNNTKSPFAEDDRVDCPISPYAATKRAAELLCHTYWRLHQLPITCLRFFTVYGPRQRPDLAIAKFLRAISAGDPVTLYGDGGSSRDYTYVDDIAQGMLSAWRNCEGFSTYNLGGNHPVSLRELVESIEETVGKRAVIERLPMQPGDVTSTYADLRKSAEDLNYNPTVSLCEGLARQWEWLSRRTAQ